MSTENNKQNQRMRTNERAYSNEDITVYWKPNACIHASICFARLIEVFNPRKRPWVDMNGAPTEKIIDIVNKCPTEALAWKWNEDQKNEAVDDQQKNHIKYMRPDLWEVEPAAAQEKKEKAEVRIQAMKDGPYVVEGEFRMLQADGSEKKFKGLTSFCRCGQTHVPPFCDGTHRKKGFTTEEE